MKRRQDTYLLVLAVVAMAIAIAAVAYGITQQYSSQYGPRYEQAVAAELDDMCATPPGYSDAQWRQHMGHHPDRYAKCLK